MRTVGHRPQTARPDLLDDVPRFKPGQQDSFGGELLDQKGKNIFGGKDRAAQRFVESDIALHDRQKTGAQRAADRFDIVTSYFAFI